MPSPAAILKSYKLFATYYWVTILIITFFFCDVKYYFSTFTNEEKDLGGLETLAKVDHQVGNRVRI